MLSCYVYIRFKRVKVSQLQNLANLFMLNSALVIEMVNNWKVEKLWSFDKRGNVLIEEMAVKR